MTKKLFLFIFLLNSLNSYAQGCLDAYEFKALKREKLQTVLFVYTPIFASGIIAVASTPLGAFALTGSLISWYEIDRNGLTNQFEKIADAIRYSESGQINRPEFKDFAKIVNKEIVKRGGLPLSLLEMSNILNEGSRNQSYCPLVKIKRNGIEKRSVFNRAALVDYVADMAIFNKFNRELINLED